MLEETIEEIKVCRQFWHNQEAQKTLKGIIEAVKRGQSLQPYLLSLPLRDEERYITWNLEGAPLQNISLPDADMKEVMLSYADFTGANLKGADFREASLYYANLSGANLQGANLEGCDITGVNFAGANLWNASFRKCDGFETDFTKANLSEANFSKSRLTKACLSGANLLNANFTDASLIMVQFEEENMKRAITQNTKMKKSGSDYVFRIRVIDESQTDLTQVLSPRAIEAIEELERIKTIVDPPPRSNN